MNNQPDEDQVFSCGFQLANAVLASNLPQRSLAFIQKLNDDQTKKNIEDPSSPFSLEYKSYEDDDDDDQNKCEIIAFCCQVRALSLLSSTLEQNPPFFNFLTTPRHNSTLSINKEAIKLFRSLHHHDPDLFQRLKNPSKKLIVTGHSLGGSVASLFCSWLLENIDQSNLNIPVCITFGSPLVGDDGFSKAIHNRSGWIPRFLHVVSDGDLIPRAFLSSNTYKPFGTFLMCSPSGSACFAHPDSVLSLLMVTGESHQISNLVDYRKLLDDLTDQMNFSNGASQLHELKRDPLRAGIILQLIAIGHSRMQVDEEEDTLITNMEKLEKLSNHEHKKHISDVDKKLNNQKTNIAQLEWYKKTCSTAKFPMGYYDCFKRQQDRRDIDVKKFKTRLNKYWKVVVEEADRKPPKQSVAPLAGRLLGAGTNYRRMVEPLDIADYYKQAGKRNYRTQGRPKHYELLQTWQEMEEKAVKHKRKLSTRDRAATLTEDSCFWADVEEAMILTKSLKNGEAVGNPEESSIENLKMFEDKVMGLIGNLAVSPEIFLEESSFMQWWNEYKNLSGRTHRSLLANFMESKLYQKYI